MSLQIPENKRIEARCNVECLANALIRWLMPFIDVGL